MVQKGIKHSELKQYFINLHALHNAQLLRETLPRSLSEPKYYLPNRRQTHHLAALDLQKTGPEKRAASAAKAAATRVKNKVEKERRAELAKDT